MSSTLTLERAVENSQAPATDRLIEFLESLASGSIPSSLRNDDDKRLRLVEAARNLTLRLEQPWDTMQRLIFCALPPHIAQVGVNLGLWDLLSSRAGEALSVSELARSTGAEEELLSRLLRYAATQWMVEQFGPDTFRASNITHHLALSGMKSVLFHV